ncbi:serine/threonine protein phosphatase PstP [Gordonia effusa NBRC 100432]|uniref:Serine/threonine protein phosphatase PstP n=1 Tax=Gordonia effusa NBRC 100432 TaxID=1077974 RepID=H0QZM3_9ACTN|nr:serine/threonine protein phosphatase PstP [Gordonia effusa NBRC 100432]
MTAAHIVRDDTATGSDVVGGLRLDWSAACNVGRVREANEDAALVLPGRFLLADGMGGHESGELASEAALLALSATPQFGDQDGTRDELEGLLRQAQQAISDIDSESNRRAGTTATGAVLVTYSEAPHWLVFNIGDSRTYCSRGGILEQVTIDHSQVQEFVDAGFMTPDQARVDPRRNVITRALGAGMSEPQADFFAFETEPGDKLLICSDGLTGELPDEELTELLNSAATPAEAVDTLVDAALALGAHDNVTVIVVSVSAVDDAESSDANTGSDGETDGASDTDDADDGSTDGPSDGVVADAELVDEEGATDEAAVSEPADTPSDGDIEVADDVEVQNAADDASAELSADDDREQDSDEPNADESDADESSGGGVVR